jgi:hypothetical protein
MVRDVLGGFVNEVLFLYVLDSAISSKVVGAESDPQTYVGEIGCNDGRRHCAAHR